MDKEITVTANEDVHPVHEEIADDNADEHAVKQEAQDASMYKLNTQKIVNKLSYHYMILIFLLVNRDFLFSSSI